MKTAYIYLKSVLSISLVILKLSCLTTFAYAQGVSMDNKEAIVVLSTVTVDEMHLAEKVLKEKGIQVESIYPPSVFIIAADSRGIEDLRKLSFIETISTGNINLQFLAHYDLETQNIIRQWNRRVEQGANFKVKFRELLKKEEGRPLNDVLKYPSDHFKTAEEVRVLNENYRKYWNKRKVILAQEEVIKGRNWNSRSLKKVNPADYGQNILSAAFSPAGTTLPVMEMQLASILETSSYFAGRVGVGIFFQGNWTSSEINTVFDQTTTALKLFRDDEPNARLQFTFINERQNVLPADQRQYVNDLRNLYKTDWSYMIVITKGDGGANADLFGPALRLFSDDLRNGYAVRHETLHVFGAIDQYCTLGGCTAAGPTSRWGYLYVVNGNSSLFDGTGLFGGAGEFQADIMKEGGPIGIYSRGQIGWRDSDGDGILDPLDTFPETSLTMLAQGSNPYRFEGKAKDIPLSNQFPGRQSVTVNTISNVKYRINGEEWISAVPLDGSFDEADEDFYFVTPQLPVGNYLIEVRSINSVENAETSFAKYSFTVSSSTVTVLDVPKVPIGLAGPANTPPKAAFHVKPENQHLGDAPERLAVFSFDAGGTSDVQDSTTSLMVRWDFENDGVWDTSYSNQLKIEHTYELGVFSSFWIVRLEVRDSAGATSQTTRTVWAVPYNHPPKIDKILWENENKLIMFEGIDEDSSTVWDGILEYRFDFNSDGTWDTPYSSIPGYILNSDLPVDPQNPKDILGEVRDRFGATSQGLFRSLQDMAEIFSPVPGSELPDTTVTFKWNNVPEAQEYRLEIGESFNQSVGLNTIQTVSGLTLTGAPLSVRLLTKINSVWFGHTQQFSTLTYDHTPPVISNANIYSRVPFESVSVSVISEDSGSGISKTILESRDLIIDFSINAFVEQQPNVVEEGSWQIFQTEVPFAFGPTLLTMIAIDNAGNRGVTNYIYHEVGDERLFRVPDNIPPSIPTGLNVVENAEHQVLLSWNPSVDSSWDAGYYSFINYEVYRNGQFIGQTAVDALEFIDQSAVPGIQYQYTILSRDTWGNKSAQSAPISIKLKDIIPPVLSKGGPVGSLAVGATQALMGLDTNEIATCKYDTVSGKSFSAMAYKFDQSSATAHSRLITGLTSTSSMKFYVRCHDAAMNYNLSDYVIKFCGSSVDCKAPTVPANVRVTAKTSTSISLAWNASTDDKNKVGYHLYRNGVLKVGTTLTTYKDSGLTPGATYVYTVEAYDASPLKNTSALSAPLSVTTQPAPTPTPTPTPVGN